MLLKGFEYMILGMGVVFLFLFLLVFVLLFISFLFRKLKRFFPEEETEPSMREAEDYHKIAAIAAAVTAHAGKKG